MSDYIAESFRLGGYFLPRCMECRRGIAMRILSVCPSVCHTRELWQNGRKICPDFYTIRFGSTDPRWNKFADFQFARSYSAVTPSEKSSINTNRKSTTRFPMSLRWSSYVAPKSPKGGLKNAKRPISVWNRASLEESLLQSLFVWKLSAAKL